MNLCGAWANSPAGRAAGGTVNQCQGQVGSHSSSFACILQTANIHGLHYPLSSRQLVTNPLLPKKSSNDTFGVLRLVLGLAEEGS